MKVRIRIPAPLRAYCDGAGEVEVAGGTVGSALAALVARHPRLRRHVFDDNGRLRPFVNVYRNESDIRELDGLDSAVSDRDEVSIVPSIAGGLGDDGAARAPAGADGAGSPADVAPDALSPAEIGRYARHLILPEVGEAGQRRLKRAKVLLVGAGGLGSPAGLYLAAAGVGTLGLVDFDVVDASNLHRQVLFGTGDVGRSKVEAAAERLADLNPYVTVRQHDARLTSENALELIREYDLVVDGSDNFPTRYLVNDACVLTGRPYVYGAIFRFEGQVSIFAAPGGPCYRCLFREPPPPGAVPSCAEGGVLGVLPGVIGSLQALEAIKWIVGAGEPMAGRLLLFDALALRWREVRLRRDPACPACGDHPSIHELMDYDAFCGVGPASTGAGAAAGDEPGTGEAALPEMSPAELNARLQRDDGIVLVDVREPYEWTIANLGPQGARLLPLSELSERLDELDPASEIVVHCRSGHRSADVVRLLLARGYPRVWNLAGGILAWADQIDPSMRRY